MGDFRAHVRLSVEINSRHRHVDLHINWSPEDCCGVDRRISEVFEEVFSEARDDFNAGMEAELAAAAEANERAEWRRLKEKYEPT